MAWLGTAQSLGFVVGPMLSSLLTQRDWHLDLSTSHFVFDGFSIPFFVAAGLAVGTMPLVIGGLPESLKTVRSLASARPHGQWTVLGLRLKTLLVLVLFSQGSLALFEAVFALYADRVLRMGLAEIGYAFALCGLVMAVFQGGAVGFLSGHVRARHQVAAGFGMLGAGLLLLLVVRSGPAVLWMVGLLALGLALITPNLLTLIANHSEPYTGAGLGLRNAFGSLGQVIGPLLGGLLFGWQAGLPFLATAGLALAIAAWIGVCESPIIA